MSTILFDRLHIFKDFPPDKKSLLQVIFQPVCDVAGTIIFEQGDLAEFLYIVVDGEVNIRYKPEDGPDLLVARIKPEGVVGWSAALGSPTYTSTAVCTSDCQMLRVRGRDLRTFCEQHPETGTLVLERLAAIIAERLRNTHHHVIAMLEHGLKISENKSVEAEK